MNSHNMYGSLAYLKCVGRVVRDMTKVSLFEGHILVFMCKRRKVLGKKLASFQVVRRYIQSVLYVVLLHLFIMLDCSCGKTCDNNALISGLHGFWNV